MILFNNYIYIRDLSTNEIEEIPPAIKNLLKLETL